jgi:hypothetical protein
MPLDPSKIKQLLAAKNKPKSKGGGRGKGKKKVDTSVRTYETWFSLDHRFYDMTTTPPTQLYCENPECLDPRKRDGKGGIMVVEVDSVFMCRYCFLDGWPNASQNPAQERLDVFDS